MTGKELLKELMAFRKWSQSKLAEETGRSQSDITGYINRGKNDIRVDILCELVNSMGCEVVIRDKMGSKTEWVLK